MNYIVEPSGRNDCYHFQVVDQSFGRNIVMCLCKTEQIAQVLADCFNKEEEPVCAR